MKDKWLVRIVPMEEDHHARELERWLNEIENQPTTEYFFLDKLVQISPTDLLAVVVITPKESTENAKRD